MEEMTVEQQRAQLVQILESEDRFFPMSELTEKTNFTNIYDILTYSLKLNPTVRRVPLFTIVVGSNNSRTTGSRREVLFCNSRFYEKLICELAETMIIENTKPLTVSDLTGKIHASLAVYLGLEELVVGSLHARDIYDILSKFQDQFIILAQSEFDSILLRRVALKTMERKMVKTDSIILRAIQILHEHESLPISKLLFKLNLVNEDFGYSKPYTIDTLNFLVDPNSEIFKIENDSISLKDLNERVSNSGRRKELLPSFKVMEDVSGLLVFYFYGDSFVLEDAKQYVNLRNAVFFHPIKNAFKWQDEVFFEQNSELFTILKALDIEDPVTWASGNLAVSFILEDYNYLKLRLQDLLNEFSPIFNIEKNPGNLFRSMIEEKLKSHESIHEK